MKKLLKNIVIFSLIIGFIALGMNLLFGEGTASYIEDYTIETATGEYETYKVFNFYNYIVNLTTNFSDLSYLQLPMPERNWINNVNDLSDIGNNLAVLVNYVIMAINIMTYPFKITGYVLKCVLGIIGIDTANQNSNLYWLVQFANVVQTLNIPYV